MPQGVLRASAAAERSPGDKPMAGHAEVALLPLPSRSPESPFGWSSSRLPSAESRSDR